MATSLIRPSHFELGSSTLPTAASNPDAVAPNNYDIVKERFVHFHAFDCRL